MAHRAACLGHAGGAAGGDAAGTNGHGYDRSRDDRTAGGNSVGRGRAGGDALGVRLAGGPWASRRRGPRRRADGGRAPLGQSAGARLCTHGAVGGGHAGPAARAVLCGGRTAPAVHRPVASLGSARRALCVCAGLRVALRVWLHGVAQLCHGVEPSACAPVYRARHDRGQSARQLCVGLWPWRRAGAGLGRLGYRQRHRQRIELLRYAGGGADRARLPILSPLATPLAAGLGAA